MGAVTPAQDAFCRRSRPRAKIARVKEALKRDDGLLVSDPHNLAWLFNIRGADVSHTPLPLGYAYVPREGRPVLLLEFGEARRRPPGKGSPSTPSFAEPDRAGRRWWSGSATGRARILFDGATAPALLTQTLERAGGKADVGADPIGLMKAAKNKAELAGARAAHERDGAALARFLAWFDAEAPRGRLTEIDAVEALESFRRATGRVEGHLLSDHRRGRAEFRHAALPGEHGEQPQDRARNLPGRQRRAVRGRDDRRHPDDRRRAPDRA